VEVRGKKEERKTRNVMVVRVTKLLRIQEALGSVLGPENGYSDCVLSWVSSVPPGKRGDRT
jgi:hypothetical protein